MQAFTGYERAERGYRRTSHATMNLGSDPFGADMADLLGIGDHARRRLDKKPLDDVLERWLRAAWDDQAAALYAQIESRDNPTSSMTWMWLVYLVGPVQDR